MSSEMVERMAKAISLWDGSDWDGPVGGRECVRDRYRAMAHAALDAVREPTDEMMVAAEEAEPVLSSFADKSESPSYRAWQAMIDAAKK